MIIASDSSSNSHGAVLLQDDKVVAYTEINSLVAYASQKLTNIKARYSYIERNIFAILFALNQFRKSITGILCAIHTGDYCSPCKDDFMLAGKPRSEFIAHQTNATQQ